MPRQRLQVRDARAVSRRLFSFVKERYGSWYRFERELGIPESTAKSWRGRDPSVPDVPYLVQFAREANLNPTWLLIGEGEQLRQPAAEGDRVQDKLRAALVAEYASLLGISTSKIARSVPGPDFIWTWVIEDLLRVVESTARRWEEYDEGIKIAQSWKGTEAEPHMHKLRETLERRARDTRRGIGL